MRPALQYAYYYNGGTPTPPDPSIPSNALVTKSGTYLQTKSGTYLIRK